MDRSRCAVSSVVLWLVLVPVWAQAPAATEPTEALDEVVVSGEYPGPGLWKITRADATDGHVLWIVGEPPPLPRRMKWKSKDIEAVAAWLVDRGNGVLPCRRFLRRRD